MSYRQEDDEQERKLFVGALNKETSDEDTLKNYFESYGTVIDCTIMRDRDGLSRGFGFVLFEEAAAVDRIMAAKKDGTDFTIDERHIEIKRALPKVSAGNAGTPRTSGLHRRIFVGGLPSSVTEDDLRSYFETYGRVNEVELLRDRETSRLRGFAFVTFDDEDSADKCIQRRSHEICKKICEVKRAQIRSNLGDREDGGRRPGGYNSRDSRTEQRNGGASASGTMSMNEVNQLIQQAFIMGQQSASGVPTAGSLPNSNTAQPSSNVLLQALMGQQPAAAPVPAPVPPAPVAPAPPANTAVLTQLAQLLQGGGIDANALGALLKGDCQQAAAPTGEKTGTGYPTAYPVVSSYDNNYSNKTSNYGPSKGDGKRNYNPY